MSGPQFFETGMGRKYYEGTMPRIATALEGIAAALSTPAVVNIAHAAFVGQVARMLTDSEVDPSDASLRYSHNEAVETLHALIAQARALQERAR